MAYRFVLTLLFGTLLAANLAWAQHDHHQIEELDFPVSCEEEARQEFEVGVALLHHMMYEQARPHFVAAAEADPKCAMAHWGVVMASFQPL